MQTMPAKTRTMLVGGVLLLLIASTVGLFYWSNYGTKEQAPEVGASLVENQGTGVTAPATGSTATQTPESATVAAPGAVVVPETHKVVEGESLSTISTQYYNTPVYAGDIEALNGITNADLIRPGIELKLPRPEDLPKIVSQPEIGG